MDVIELVRKDLERSKVKDRIIKELKIALHDAINSPKGVVPKSAEKYKYQNRVLI